MDTTNDKMVMVKGWIDLVISVAMKLTLITFVFFVAYGCWKITDRLLPVQEKSASTQPNGGDTSALNYKDALEILRNEQTSWLTILGFFGVIFGLVVPIGAYLLQQKSLSEERERMMGEVKEYTDRIVEQGRRIDTLKNDIEKLQQNFDGQNKPFWQAMGFAFEWSVITSELFLSLPELTDDRIATVIANVLLNAELMLDSYVLTNDVEMLKKKIDLLKDVIKDIKRQYPELYDKALGIVKELQEARCPLVQNGNRYQELVDSSNSDYQWLKEFFRGFAPGKLG